MILPGAPFELVTGTAYAEQVKWPHKVVKFGAHTFRKTEDYMALGYALVLILFLTGRQYVGIGEILKSL